MQEDKDSVKVTIAGGSYGANTLVFGVVHDALKKAQFRHVSPYIVGVSDPPGERRIDSLLDVCRAIHPDLFSTPVQVEQDLSAVRFADDVVYPTTAALEETINKAVHNDYVDYYSADRSDPLGAEHLDDEYAAQHMRELTAALPSHESMDEITPTANGRHEPEDVEVPEEAPPIEFGPI